MSCPVRVTATFQKQAYGVEVTFSLQETLHIVSRLLIFGRNSIIVGPHQMNGYKNAIKKELYAEYFGLDKYYLRCGKFGSHDYHCNPAKETK